MLFVLKVFHIFKYRVVISYLLIVLLLFIFIFPLFYFVVLLLLIGPRPKPKSKVGPEFRPILFAFSPTDQPSSGPTLTRTSPVGLHSLQPNKLMLAQRMFPSFPQSLHAFLLSTRSLFAHLRLQISRPFLQLAHTPDITSLPPPSSLVPAQLAYFPIFRVCNLLCLKPHVSGRTQLFVSSL